MPLQPGVGTGPMRACLGHWSGQDGMLVSSDNEADRCYRVQHIELHDSRLPCVKDRHEVSCTENVAAKGRSCNRPKVFQAKHSI